MDCKFNKNGSEMTCSVCGFSMKYIPGDVRRNCVIHEYPSIIEQGMNFISSVVENVITGGEQVTEEIYKDRLSICDGTKTGQICEFYDNNRCKKCGCFFASKVWLASEKCPIDKW